MTFPRSWSLRSRGLVACAAVFGAVALGIGLTVAPASASTLVVTVQWYDYQTNLCLDSNYAAAVYTDGCNGGNYQNWNMWDNGSLGGGIQDAQTGLCLDSNYAKNVYTYACNSGDAYQEWTGGGEGPGDTIQDVQTGFCLDSNYAGSVYTYACNWNDTYQNWISQN